LQNLQRAEKGESPAIKESISLIQQLTQAMPKPQGVGELVSALADLKKLTGGGTEGGNSMLETIKVLKELGIVGAERKSLASEIKEILEIAGLIGGGEGGGRAAKQDWGTALVTNLPTILEKATPIADKFADAARHNARVAEMRLGRIPPPDNTAPAAAPAPSAAAAPAAAAPAAESPAPRMVAAPETEPAGNGLVAPNLEWVKARAVELFGRGESGDFVAEWLDTIDDRLGQIFGSMDESKFRAFVESDNILHAISTAPRFPEFVAQFVDYFTGEDGTDQAQHPENS
jgi:hypothetical protein